MNATSRVLALFLSIAAVLITSGCDFIGLGSKTLKCDDTEALQLTARLLAAQYQLRGGFLLMETEPLPKDHVLTETRMILNRGSNHEIGRTSCTATFVFTNPNQQPTTDACKWISRAKYALQYDTTGQLVTTISEAGELSCEKFTPDEVENLTKNITDPVKQNELGLRFATGDGVTKNSAEAARWFLKAAQQGNISAQYQLATMYDVGEGVPRNISEAVKWYEKAAKQGDAASANNLAVIFEKGNGINQDIGKAEQWYLYAAERGYAAAQYNLGRLYGGFTPLPTLELAAQLIDETKAFRWFLSAAEDGHVAAQYAVGNYFFEGQGVDKDICKGILWLQRASQAGYIKAKQSLDKVTEEQRASCSLSS